MLVLKSPHRLCEHDVNAFSAPSAGSGKRLRIFADVTRRLHGADMSNFTTLGRWGKAARSGPTNANAQRSRRVLFRPYLGIGSRTQHGFM